MKKITRRNFIKIGGISSIASLVPQLHANHISSNYLIFNKSDKKPYVHFLYDGIDLDPIKYAELLHKLTKSKSSINDSYGKGGAVERLEIEFAKITGKESAIFMPSGTMANQLAIKIISNNKSKVFVQELSHVYRDEADAAQTVHNKRLMPLAKGKGNFTLDELLLAIDYFHENEGFHTDIGAISIENTVRRAYEEIFDIKEIRKISNFSKENNIKMHLDGARIFMASAYSGISVEKYSSYFDTIYISLYKYLGAGAGAILCGSKDIISRMPHLIKIHGGNMYWNWHNAAIALHFLEGFEQRISQAKTKAVDLFQRLNQLEGIKVKKFAQGSNVFKLFIQGVNIDRFRENLQNKMNIYIRQLDKGTGFIPIKVNETQLTVSNDYLVNAFQDVYKLSAS